MTAAPVLARSLKYTVTISAGEGAGKVYSFEKPIVTIGRGPENDLVFSNDPKMSRSHAEIRVQSGQLYVRNVSQKNFILVDSEKIDEKLIAKTCKVQVGETIFVLKLELPPQALSTLRPAAAMPMKNPQPVAVAQTMSQVEFGAPSSHNPPSNAVVAKSGNSRIRFYSIIAIVGVVGYLVLSDGVGSKKQEVNLRTEGDVARAVEDSAKAVIELKKQQETTGQDSIQFKAASEHYIKGFRDYRQGQYARAMQSFQAALSFYPSHELARKYLVQAQRKFDEMVGLSMSQGRKYYQKQNYKMCQSSFANAMIMVKDSTKPKYKEAKQFYEECSLRAEGKF